MAKKAFLTMLVLLIGTFAFSATIRFYRPDVTRRIDIATFPLTQGEWSAKRIPIETGVVEMLNPDAIFNALYTSSGNEQIDVFFSYFAGDNAQGGVHSPRNCMPGSGWVIEKTEPHSVRVGDRIVPASRMFVHYGRITQAVDYWYITRHGETSSDYTLKLYTMFSALSFRPNDVAFVRFIGSADPSSLAELDRFEQEMARQIYAFLPFGQ